MQYGISVDCFQEYKEILCKSPFQVLEQGETIILQKKLIIGTKLNILVSINENYTIGELFLDLFYRKQWYYCPDDKTIDVINNEISDIFFPESVFSLDLTPKQRYNLLHEFAKRTKKQFQYTETPFLGDLTNQAEIAGLPSPDTYLQAIECAAKLKYQLPQNKTLVFDNSNDLLLWAFTKVIDSNQSIGCCPMCNLYFLKKSYAQKFCSSKCYKFHKASGSFCGDDELKKLYQTIYQAFRRKISSQGLYLYLSCNFDDNYDESVLFSRLSGQEKCPNPLGMLFTSSAFQKMEKIYMKNYNIRYKVFKDAYCSYHNGKISEQAYISTRMELCSWLKNVRNQLKAFELDRSGSQGSSVP